MAYDEKKRTIFQRVKNRDLVKLKALPKSTCSPNKYDVRGTTALHCIAQTGNIRIADILISNGAEVDKVDWDGHTPLYNGAENGHKEIVELLLSHGAKVNTVDKNGQTPLQAGAVVGRKEIVELLLGHGAEVNTVDKNGQTPLQAGAVGGHEEIVELLLSHGAEVNRADKNGCTALYASAVNGHKEIVKLLLSYGAKVNTANKNEQTPLHAGAVGGHKEIVELLLSHGAEVNTADKEGLTPVYAGAKEGHKEIVELLLRLGAAVNTTGENGWTPLHVSSFKGHREIAELLIKHGADIDPLDNVGKSPLLVAKGMGYKDIVNLLRQAKHQQAGDSKLLKMKQTFKSFFRYEGVKIQRPEFRGHIKEILENPTDVKIQHTLDVGRHGANDEIQIHSVVGKSEIHSNQEHEAELPVTSPNTNTCKTQGCILPKLSSSPQLAFSELPIASITPQTCVPLSSLKAFPSTSTKPPSKFIPRKSGDVLTSQSQKSDTASMSANQIAERLEQLREPIQEMVRSCLGEIPHDQSSLECDLNLRKGNINITFPIKLCNAINQTVDYATHKYDTRTYHNKKQVFCSDRMNVNSQMAKRECTKGHVLRESVQTLPTASDDVDNIYPVAARTPLISSLTPNTIGTQRIREPEISVKRERKSKEDDGELCQDHDSLNVQWGDVVAFTKQETVSNKQVQTEEVRQEIGNAFVVKCSSERDEVEPAPSCRSAWLGCTETVDFLLSHGAAANENDYNECTPLHYATWRGDQQMVEILLSHGAVVNVKDKFGQTPLHVSVYYNHKAIVSKLITHGADVNAKDDKGLTPLNHGTWRNYKEIVDLLIKGGAEANATDKSRQTPLHNT